MDSDYKVAGRPKTFKRLRDVRRSVLMGKEETLRKLKEAEAQVRALKDAAERERERALRDARREALELQDRLRADAEERYRQVVAGADASLRLEREPILAAGREEAARVKARGMGNVEAAAKLVVDRFRGSIRA